ncbi:MAG TPA: ABC transporter ATP-binding protein [Candidatus Binataceae bacterium]|nr:ABC transporter ATP-binding protein [Candidatus Binataceae bacterium]
MESIISVRDLGKRYKIGARLRYRTLRDSVMESGAAAMRALSFRHRRNGTAADDDETHVWALREVSFDVMPGEVIGIIGRNGAGKSTLLKILARITEPTTGRVDLYGRVGSLLEVGTGFHPELTGRENIYLSAVILGMHKAEIERKFDEIVAFAEIEKFIDTSVKHYSSGMYVRLAFAVAAHLEPEILLVDEVLAVGDLAFQKKCLGKMGEVARGGRTVILVSHNMASIESLCDTCLLLDAGQLRRKGHSVEVIRDYLAAQVGVQSASRSLLGHPGRRSNSESIMKSVTLRSESDTPVTIVPMGAPLSIAVEFEKKSGPFCPVLGVVVKTSQGWRVLCVNNRFVAGYRFENAITIGTITCCINDLPLTPGTYFIDLYLGDHHQDFDIVFEAATIEVIPADVFGTGKLPPPGTAIVYIPAAWQLSDGPYEPE